MRETYNGGYFLISRSEYKNLLAPTNAKWLKCIISHFEVDYYV